jgi:hypothetical protein
MPILNPGPNPVLRFQNPGENNGICFYIGLQIEENHIHKEVCAVK